MCSLRFFLALFAILATFHLEIISSQRQVAQGRTFSLSQIAAFFNAVRRRATNPTETLYLKLNNGEKLLVPPGLSSEQLLMRVVPCVSRPLLLLYFNF